MIKQRVLFVCTENSCRSQMAEGFLRHHAGDRFEVFSGGAQPGELNPTAVKVMKEVGIDISGHSSKDVAQFLGQNFHYIIPVPDKVKGICLALPGAICYQDSSLEGPFSVNATLSGRLAAFGPIRDEIDGHVLDSIAKES
jgi:arsenate reductase